MKTLNILIFLLVFNNFILMGYLSSQMTGKVVYERITANLTRAIDGDTVVIADGTHLRLLGINTPEKKNPGYEEAKAYLAAYEGKMIEVESRGTDKYKRTLAYIYYNNYLLNSEILRRGLATLYVYDKDEHYSELEKAEKYAQQNNLGLWVKSQDFGCIQLVKLQYIEKERCKNQEQLTLENKCSAMGIILKDDANHIENINLPSGIYIENFSCVWNDAGDSLYIRDNKGLILFYRY